MVGIVTILLALPLGFLLGSLLVANLTYALAYLWAFVFQTLYLLLPSLDGTTGLTFEAGVFPWSYGLVTLTILVVGFGLVALGHRLRLRYRPGRGLT
ncbi:hypothetical protein [Janibacter sp. DB-40]|uniref:hypothetical protein n=1 Tax=Janibacter sp. DB-40 TaxID=3028808 RepID=UPI002404BB4E|nr:hypothetical protein [Janibacter sp. DB-40]